MKLLTLILSATFLAISTAASIQQHIQPVAPVDPGVKADVGEIIKDVLKDVAETVVDIHAGEKVNPTDLLDTVRDAKADIAEIVAEARTVTHKAPIDVIDTIEDALEDAVDTMDDAMDTVQDAQEDAADNVADVIDTVQDAQEDATDNMDDAIDTIQDAQEDAADIVDDIIDTIQDAQEDSADNVADFIDTVQDAQEDAVDNVADSIDTIQDAQEDAADNMVDTIDTIQDAQEDAADIVDDVVKKIIENILDVEPKDLVEEIREELKEMAEKDTDVIDKINMENLSDEEVRSLLNAEQEQLVGFLDVYLGANELQKKNSSPVRRKRWIPVIAAVGRVAFSGGRALFKRFASKGITRSGDRITKHYSRPGNYFSGLREFKNLNPTNVKKIGGSKFNGWTGTSGPYRVTVRSGSKGTAGSNGSPTLSISSKGGKLVRKFRFERK